MQRLEHPLQRHAGREVVDEVVPELGELVEDHVVRVGLELLAAVVDLLDVALGARGPHDVAGVGHPPGEPVEALAAHALGEHRDASAPEQLRDRDASPAVVAGRRPHGPLPGGIELPADESRDQAAVGGKDLVRPNEWKAVPERHDDRGVDAGQLTGKHDVVRDVDQLGPARSVVPVHAKEVQWMSLVRPDCGQRLTNLARDQPRIRKLAERRKYDAGVAKPIDRSLEGSSVDQLVVSAR